MIRFRLYRIFAATAAVAALSCSDSSGPTPGVTQRRVSPSQANPAINNFTADNLIWLDPAQTSRHLVLFLSGTQGVPEAYTLVGPIVAALGYRVIGLTYVNDLGVVYGCTLDPEPECMEHMRQEMVDGAGVSRYVDVNPVNSISGRLTDLLRRLASQYPNEGWEYFVDADAPRWSAITVSGHSQGGGHAAYIAKTRLVERVVMFGAPADGYNGNAAPWMQIGVTPVSRYYGFRHVRDQFTSISPNWLALGMDAFGTVRTIDASTTDFGGGHMFTTDILPSTGTYNEAHASVVADGATPLKPDGTPLYANIWRYLFGRP